jgi:hypothetical protein
LLMAGLLAATPSPITECNKHAGLVKVANLVNGFLRYTE